MWARHQERDTEAKMFLCGTGGRWPTDTWLLCLDFVWLYWCYWSPPHCKVLVSWLDMFWPDDLAHEGVRHHVFNHQYTWTTDLFFCCRTSHFEGIKVLPTGSLRCENSFSSFGLRCQLSIWHVLFGCDVFYRAMACKLKPPRLGWSELLVYLFHCRVKNIKSDMPSPSRAQSWTSIPVTLIHSYSSATKKDETCVNVYNSLITVYYQLSPRFQYQRQPLKEWFAEALLLKDTVVLWFNLTGYNQFSPSEDHVGRRIGGLGWL